MTVEIARNVYQTAFGPEVPLAIAVCSSNGQVETVAQGIWPSGEPVRRSDRFYGASLAKQITGVAAAVLVREGRLDPDLPVAHYIPNLPVWANDITARHLAHHIAGLPAAGEVEPAIDNWTEAFASAALRQLPRLTSSPGTVYSYSNLGYVLLAHVIAQASDIGFSQFTRVRLFERLGLDDLEFVGSNIGTFPQAGLMGPSKPLTMGDGGLWTTAGGFSRWLHHQNQDTLGVAETVTIPGRLIDGKIVDYGWGLGLRRRNGQPLYIHGGEWAGCTAFAVRSPSLGLGIAAFSSGASIEDLRALVEDVLDRSEHPELLI